MSNTTPIAQRWAACYTAAITLVHNTEYTVCYGVKYYHTYAIDTVNVLQFQNLNYPRTYVLYFIISSYPPSCTVGPGNPDQDYYSSVLL